MMTGIIMNLSLLPLFSLLVHDILLVSDGAAGLDFASCIIFSLYSSSVYLCLLVNE